MIWNEWPVPTVIAGASVVIASNFLMIWRESRLERAAKSHMREKS
jgi:hypothetical protein